MGVSDFEPTTDLPERIDDDDTPVESSARARDEAIQRARRRILRLLIVWQRSCCSLSGSHRYASSEPWSAPI